MSMIELLRNISASNEELRHIEVNPIIENNKLYLIHLPVEKRKPALYLKNLTINIDLSNIDICSYEIFLFHQNFEKSKLNDFEESTECLHSKVISSIEGRNVYLILENVTFKIKLQHIEDIQINPNGLIDNFYMLTKNQMNVYLEKYDRENILTISENLPIIENDKIYENKFLQIFDINKKIKI